MIRPIALAACLSLVAVSGGAVAQTAPAQTPPSPPSGTPGVVVEREPVRIAGCEAYGEACSEGSGRAAAGDSRTGAYIDQVRGSGNTASITQRRGSTQSFASITQSGDGNTAGIEQNAPSAFAEIAQDGDRNGASITQGGTAHSTAAISQTGDGNAAGVRQSAGWIAHAAAVTQNGNRNRVALNQEGNGNSAILSQNGDDNAMSVDQSGFNNALTWEQNGSNLSGPTVTMEGIGRELTIIQSNMYAPPQ